MFKIITVALVSLLFFPTGFAQNAKPDFKKIEKETKDKSSHFFYSALLKRYNNNDTTLTEEEYRYVYYGSSFQDNYSPYGKPSVNDELKKAINADATDKVIELERKALAEYLFNLRDLYTLSRMLLKKGDSTGADAYHDKMVALGRAIISTGDGTSDSSAIYVISVDHEYDLISLLGYKFGGGQALINKNGAPMDQMKLEKNRNNVDYLYFNVERLFAAMDKLFKDRK
jgi:hypothetical protein